MADNNKIEKALSPEDQTALANIIAIGQEILQSNSGEAVDEAMKDQYTEEDYEKKKPEEGNINKAAFEGKETPEEEKEEEAKKAKKAIENTSSEGGTAMTDAEDLEEENNTEATNEGVKEVAKMLTKLLSGAAPVKKSKPSQTVQAMSAIAKAISSISQRQTMIEKTLENLLSVTGITKQLEVVQKSQEKKVQPVQTMDMESLANFIAKSIGSNKLNGSSVEKSQSEAVIGELADLVSTFNGRRQ